MWDNLDWGWSMGAHMLLWWSLVLMSVITIAGLIYLTAPEDQQDESSRPDGHAPL